MFGYDIHPRSMLVNLLHIQNQTGTKFYINFLYVLTKALNTRDDYKMRYLYQEDKLVVFDKINTSHYVFHEDTETFTVVYTEFSEDYHAFYDDAALIWKRLNRPAVMVWTAVN